MNFKQPMILTGIVIAGVLVIAAICAVWILLKNGGFGTGNDSSRGGELTVNFIDVGKGDCIMIRSKSHTMLIDTGYKSTTEDVFAYLDKSGITKIDALILTHYDKDHIGGAQKLLSDYPVEKLYIPDYDSDSKKFRKLLKAIDKNDVAVEYVTSEITFSADKVKYTVLPSGVAYNSKKENDNDLSLVVTAVNGKDSYIFTGDIEKAGINHLLGKIGRTYDIIKMPHHGRMEDNSKALLERVGPAYAVITDGKEQTADTKLCLLLRNAGVSYYCTSENGTVTVKSDGNGNYFITTEK